MIKRGKVLVIDDEPSIVELFTDYLNGQGFDVISAGGGEEGLDRLRLDGPDIVLLDMRMPELEAWNDARVFRSARTMSAAGRASIAPALESAALSLVQRGSGGDKAETVRTLNTIRSLLRFAKDLGDITDEMHRSLESRHGQGATVRWPVVAALTGWPPLARAASERRSVCCRRASPAARRSARSRHADRSPAPGNCGWRAASPGIRGGAPRPRPP